ncbi:MAG TPA: DUF1150 family protein [Xanthobacteraceae bacterium]|nr:DUF1150 family protein [Xanthobacteraceae bacterium]
MNHRTNEGNTNSPVSPEALALLGGGRIAYVKAIRSEDVAKMFPQAPQIARLLRDPEIARKLRDSEDVEALYAVLTQPPTAG